MSVEDRQLSMELRSLGPETDCRATVYQLYDPFLFGLLRFVEEQLMMTRVMSR